MLLLQPSVLLAANCDSLLLALNVLGMGLGSGKAESISPLPVSPHVYYFKWVFLISTVVD